MAIEIAQHVNFMSCCLISSCWRWKHQKDNSNLFINIIMIFKRILAFGLLLPIFLGIRLKLSVDRNEGPVCFYENLRNWLPIKKKMKSTFSRSKQTLPTSGWMLWPKTLKTQAGRRWLPKWPKESHSPLTRWLSKQPTMLSASRVRRREHWEPQ